MLDYIALALVFVVFFTLFYGIIVIHDIPYDIAKHRNHPHQDAIHVAGWVSLLTLHVIWPFLWIWATLYREDRGWGFKNGSEGADDDQPPVLEHINRRLDALQAQINALQAQQKGD